MAGKVLITEPVIAQHFPQLVRTLIEVGITNAALAQDLLDELSGAIEAGNREDRKKIGNPSAWLKSLAEGEFIRNRCFDIQARRRATRENEHRRQYVMSPIDDDDPRAKAKGEELLAAIRQRRDSASSNREVINHG